MNKEKSKCEHPDHEFYPNYGPAPHFHDLSGGSFIRSTRLIPKQEWPENFVEDSECPGLGSYYCPGCLEFKKTNPAPVGKKE